MHLNYFKTGIEALDKMLGSKGIPSQNIILLKGGPGSGKTTLGLQIINNHLNQENYNAGFISMEVDCNNVKNYVKKHYGFTNLDKESFFVTSSDELRKTIKDYFNPEKSHIELSKALIKCLKNSKIHIQNKNEYKTILFFDSLNILIDIIQSSIQNISSKEISKREIIKSICNLKNEDHSTFENTIFIFSVEHHSSYDELNSLISESFLCDTEILLNIEPIHENVGKSFSNISSVGYKIDSDNDGKKTNEYRSFCRVLKTRFSNHESRRCAYDIKEEQGLKFYETYPGDGQICLFYENDRQKEAWDVFYKEDIPNQFPTLRYDKFERNSLQQNFSTRRRFLYMPEKTDLYLASFDNYWVHWYINIFRKWTLQDIIKEKSIIYRKYYNDKSNAENNDSIPVIPELINEIHSVFTKPIIKSAFHGPRQPIDDNNYIIEYHENQFLLISYLNGDIQISISNDISELKYYKIRSRINKIQNVKSIGYISHIGREELHLDAISDLIAIGNIEGMIIIVHEFSLGREKNPIKKLVLANYSHHVIEFKTEEDKDVILFDNIYNVVYKKESTNQNVNPESKPFRSSFLINGKISDIADNNNGSYLISKNSADYECFQNIINKFLEDDKTNLGNQITKTLSTERAKNCFECHNIRSSLNNINNFHTLKEVEFSDCQNLYNILEKEILDYNVNEEKSANELDTYIKQVQHDGIYSALKELTKNKYFACNYSPPQDKIQKVSLKFKIKDKDLIDQENNKCNWAIDVKETIKKFCDEHHTVIDVARVLKYINRLLFNVFNTKVTKDLYKLIKNQVSHENQEKLEIYLQYDILNIYISLLKNKESKSFFIPIIKSETRLFGEKRSEIISELSNYNFSDNRPFHFQDFLFSLHNSDNYISVPYDANIGIFVYRKNELKNFYTELNGEKKEAYKTKIIENYNNQIDTLNEVLIGNKFERIVDGDGIYDKISDLVDRSIYDNYPKTWEEIFAIRSMLGIEFRFIIETQTYDTYLTNYLELLWNCGGDLCVGPNYKIDDIENTVTYMLQALYYFAFMFYNGFIPESSTLEVEPFSKHYEGESQNQDKKNWLFMRQYYSTFVELLTSKKKNQKTNEMQFIWNPPKGTELGLMPMPVSLSKYLKEENPYKVKHCTCWGDWHLGILKGSENITLGKELINHLMSSHKIVERAFSNASIPTTEEFYSLYKNSNCFNIPERNEIELPTTTYQELRNKYFAHGRSRSQVFDYRHCMREIHSVLKFAEHHAIRNKNDEKSNKLPSYILSDIFVQLKKALKSIEDFKNRGILNY